MATHLPVLCQRAVCTLCVCITTRALCPCINHSWRNVFLGCIKVPVTGAGTHPFCHGERWILSMLRDVRGSLEESCRNGMSSSQLLLPCDKERPHP